MPRVSAQHEQEVRERIVRAATRVFSERGFHRATMQDIVRASGLSVGAIYTYFKSKDELVLAGCDMITDQEMSELARRLAPIEGFRERISAAVGFLFDQMEVESWQLGSTRLLALAWAEADTSPGDPRDAPPTAARDPRRDGRASSRRASPAASSRPGSTSIGSPPGSGRCSTGSILQSIEEGAGYRRSESERRVLAMIELLIAAASVPASPRLEAAPPRAIGDRREQAAS